VKRPVNFTYWVNEVPPLGVMLISALQHVGLVCAFLPIPLAIAREAGLPASAVVTLISVSMLALGVASILQSINRGPVGSGLLAPSCFSGAYLAPSLLAVKTGGLSLVLGMTIFGGFIEMALSRLLRYLRPFLPPEIAGFVVVLVGMTVGGLGVRYMLGVGAPGMVTDRDVLVSGLTLALMVALSVWGRGMPRLFCALLGMIGGYALAAMYGLLTVEDLARSMSASLVGFPAIGSLGWSFDSAFIIPFAVGAVASCLKTVGDLTTAQKINDADWVRPDLTNIGRGTLANGIGSALSGLFGTVGMNTSSANIGVSGATGVTSRVIGYATGGLFILLAFMPKFSGFLAAMPRPVMGAALIFVAAFIFVNGLQIIASRLLDPRRTFVIGLSFIVAIAIDITPEYFRSLPQVLQPLVSSSLVAGMIAAVLLNLVFRIGARKVQRITVSSADPDYVALQQFIEACGAAWGARRDVVMRANQNLQQAIDTIRSTGLARGLLEVEASFDDFDVDVRVAYDGGMLDLPETRPTIDEVIDTAQGERLLAGYMLRQFADHVSTVSRDQRVTILFKFVH